MKTEEEILRKVYELKEPLNNINEVDFSTQFIKQDYITYITALLWVLDEEE